MRTTMGMGKDWLDDAEWPVGIVVEHNDTGWRNPGITTRSHTLPSSLERLEVSILPGRGTRSLAAAKADTSQGFGTTASRIGSFENPFLIDPVSD